MNHEREVKRYLLARPLTAWLSCGPGLAAALAEEVAELLPNLLTPSARRRARRTQPAPPAAQPYDGQPPGGPDTAAARRYDEQPSDYAPAARESTAAAPALHTRRDAVVLRGIDYRSVLELALRLTCAQDVSVEIARGRVPARQALDRMLASVRWGLFFRAGARVALRVDSRASTLYHEGLVRDAAAAAMRDAGLVAVAARDEAAGARVSVRIERDWGRVLLSVAGAPLWRRGYRARLHARAPLREDLAQAAIRAVYITFPVDLPAGGTPAIDPRPQTLFVPFSGTGTFLFEWLLCRFAIAPALFARAYDFQSFAAGVPPSVPWLTRRLMAVTAERIAASGPVRARLIDLSREAMDGARESFGRFGDAAGRALPVSVDWIVGDAFEVPWERLLADAEGDLFIALNPPYGRRLAARVRAPGGEAESRDDAGTPGAAVQGREHRGTAELYRKIGESCEALARAWADLAVGTDAARAALPAANGVTLHAPGRRAARIRGCILCPGEASWSAFVKATPAFENRTSHFSQGGIDVRLCVFAAPAQR